MDEVLGNCDKVRVNLIRQVVYFAPPSGELLIEYRVPGIFLLDIQKPPAMAFQDLVHIGAELAYFGVKLVLKIFCPFFIFFAVFVYPFDKVQNKNNQAGG
jgi:hypothetical protein